MKTLVLPVVVGNVPISIIFTVVGLIFSVSAHNNPYRHIANLDLERYVLEWVVNWTNRSVTFNVTVETTGYVGFGFSARGSKTGADLLMGGVDAEGHPYLFDMHGATSTNSDNVPVQDQSQDYTLLSAWENGTHTSILFSRPFETCDESGNDYTLNDDTVVILWCYGENDNTQHYHYRNRGIFKAYLLDPDWTPREFQNAKNDRRVATAEERGDLKVWTVTRHQRVAARETVYWCSLHKGPQLQKRHHLVGFNFRWKNQIEFERTHHIILLRCQAPHGADPVQFYEPFLKNNTGEMCYFFENGANGGLPLQTCRDLVYPYTIGEQMFFLPEHAGIPFGDNPNEYYLLQVHYDNNDVRSDLEYTVNVDLYYTENLRENEAGIATVGHHIPGSPSILIPPATPAENIYGHCSSDCTRGMLPPEGIKILAVQQHTHLSGRRHVLRQFRDGKELPWILNDDNYDARFQGVRMQRRDTLILPGDHLVVRCVFDNTWTDRGVVGGFGVRQEMCLVYMWYYNKMTEYSLCRSEISDLHAFAEKHLGVSNYTWDENSLEQVVTKPYNMTGLTIRQVAETQVKWNIEKRQSLRMDLEELPQQTSCPSFTQSRDGNSIGFGGVVTNPKGVAEYVPVTVTVCPEKSPGRGWLGGKGRWWRGGTGERRQFHG